MKCDDGLQCVLMQRICEGRATCKDNSLTPDEDFCQGFKLSNLFCLIMRFSPTCKLDFYVFLGHYPLKFN